MRFKSKLLLVYLLLVAMLVVTFGTVFYISSTSALEKNAYTNLDVLVDKMSQQLDSLVRPMDFISLNLLSNGTFMSSMISLVRLDRYNTENFRFINDAYVEINRALMNYTLARDYYRVSMFNPAGDFLSSNNNAVLARSRYRETIDNIPWTDLVWKNNGQIVILPPYTDPWTQKQQVKVFGVARTVRGTDYNIGYIEVQALYQSLEKLFYVEDASRISVLAVTGEDTVFYSSGIKDPSLLDFYHNVARKRELAPTSLAVPGSHTSRIVTVTTSNYTGIRILLAQDKEVLLYPSRMIMLTIVVTAASIMILSFIYVFIFSWRLTKPLQQLKEEIEHTRFENLPCEISLSSSNNEIEALNGAFINLRERLNSSVKREINARNLHLQASFESLQARINPHFIYNILNVLSNRGILYGDTVIYDICQSIAAMLRYSTSAGQLTAMLSEELEHVKNYLHLMKKRFENRLTYSIEFDPELLKIEIPKIVLQPLVENSINHGFVDVHKDMDIRIFGYRQDHRWFIELHDNGQGFKPAVLEDLNSKVNAAFDMDRLAERGLGIGGMGILNVYSRLALHFHNSGFHFLLQNKPEGGACIIIGSSIDPMEVSHNEDESPACR